jgi:ribosomal protein S18 acetylase RimI-like enzyme
MVAEVDFTVHPNYARKGIATSMVRHIAENGKQRGVKTLVSYTGNQRVFGVFRKLDYVMESSLSAGVYEIRVLLDRRNTPIPESN